MPIVPAAPAVICAHSPGRRTAITTCAPSHSSPRDTPTCSSSAAPTAVAAASTRALSLCDGMGSCRNILTGTAAIPLMAPARTIQVSAPSPPRHPPPALARVQVRELGPTPVLELDLLLGVALLLPPLPPPRIATSVAGIFIWKNGRFAAGGSCTSSPFCSSCRLCCHCRCLCCCCCLCCRRNCNSCSTSCSRCCCLCSLSLLSASSRTVLLAHSTSAAASVSPPEPALPRSRFPRALLAAVLLS
mmetsp:Transcript_34781/g.87231  ORF Transcript_34781/g.87231 Transcript_34781/m.87231 type:complete len:245 (-) Transcript_34781:921-1655(-)